MPGPERPLLERDTELRALDEAFARAASGAGGLIVVEGAAGLGKSALLEAAADAAADAGLRTLSARGRELEREFAFGAVRQLFERALSTPSRRERLLAGPAAPAGRAVSPESGAPEEGVTAGFATLHAIYWLAVNLAEDQPLLLVLDDAHWADPSSLRALAYLGARIAETPVALLTASRPDEPGAPAQLLDELSSDPAALRVELAPLGEDSVTQVVRERLATADDSVCRACHEATGGNPLYLQELLNEVESEDGNAGKAVREAAVGSLGDRVVRRIARVAANAPELAAAMAVLGEGRLSAAASLGGVSVMAAGRMAHRLRRIDVLASEDPFAFAHPLVRRSVYDSLPAPERDAAHVRAAEVLRVAGAPAEAIAAHFATLPPRGSTEVAATLMEAADQALARAAPDEAVRWFNRALEEEAPEPPAAAILAGLGITELLRRDEQAIPHLEQALELAEDPDLRARVATYLAQTLIFVGRWDQAAAVIRSVRKELASGETEADIYLAAMGLMVSSYLPGEVRSIDRSALAELATGGSVAASALAAVLAAVAAHRGEGADKVGELVDRAVDENDRPMTEPRGRSWVTSCLVIALAETEEHRRALRVCDAVSAEARRDGSTNDLFVASDHRGWVYARRGDLAAAEAELRPGIEMALGMGAPTVLATQLFYIQEALLERPTLEDVAERALAFELDPYLSPTYVGAMIRTVRGRLRMARLDRDGGIEDLRTALRTANDLGLGPAVAPSRSLVALALPPSEREQALALVAEELDLARAAGLPRGEGVALRAAGVLEGGDEGLRLLRASADVLEGSDARLEHARSLIELGAALRRAGQRAEARGPLAAGIEIAHGCGAIHLVEHGQEELRAAGGRNRRIATTGVEALTASELRVARMASRGATNPEIAQELFVSPKTIETHLSNAYAKLGLAGQGSRARLAESLSD